MIIEQVCKSCGKSFSTEATRLHAGRGKYCSIGCRGLARRAKPINRIYIECGKEFQIIPRLLKISKGWYCSRPCFWAARRGKETLPFAERLAGGIYFPANEDDCAIWTGQTDKAGYGKISKLINGKTASLRVHRAVYELYFGLLDPSINVLHSCDIPPCCNIRHLFPGSQQDNIKDKVTKDRQAKGERNGRAKLSEIDVMKIKHFLRRGKIQHDIATRFNVSEVTISAIKFGRLWKHVP